MENSHHNLRTTTISSTSNSNPTYQKAFQYTRLNETCAQLEDEVTRNRTQDLPDRSYNNYSFSRTTSDYGQSSRIDNHQAGLSGAHTINAYNFHQYTNISSIRQQQLQKQVEYSASQTARSTYGSNISEEYQYFFESPSKYVSLKKHRQQNADFKYDIPVPQNSNSGSLTQNTSGYDHSTTTTTTLQTESGLIKQTTTTTTSQNNNIQQQLQQQFKGNSKVFGGQIEKGLSIRKWFEQLCIADKSLVMTVIDKQLVQLILEMYSHLNPHGKFTNLHYPNNNSDGYEKIKQYDLLFKSCELHKNYEPKSEYLLQQFQAEETLIKNIRLLNLNHRDEQRIANENKKKQLQNQKNKTARLHSDTQKIRIYDAFTLDLDLLENTTFFFDILKRINQNQDNFLKSELIITDKKSRLDKSVFYSNYGQDDPTAGFEQKKDAYHQDKPRKFYTFQQSQNSYFGKDKNAEFTLSQCLYTIFEKAINVQYYDYIGKLTADQQGFFFTTPEYDIFTYDLKLSYYWLSIEKEQRNKIIKNLDDLEKKIEKEIHLKSYRFEEITEMQQEYSKSSSSQSIKRRDEENTPYFYGATSSIATSQRKQSQSDYSDNFENDDEEEESDGGDLEIQSKFSRFKPKTTPTVRTIERNQNDYANPPKSQISNDHFKKIANDRKKQMGVKSSKSKASASYYDDEEDSISYQQQSHSNYYSYQPGRNSMEDDMMISSHKYHQQNNILMINNLYKIQKTNLLVKSQKASDIKNCYIFIRCISADINLLTALENKDWMEIKLEFYQKLIEYYENSVIEDLMNYDKTSHNNSNSNTGNGANINNGGNSGGINKNQKALTNESSKNQNQPKKQQQQQQIISAQDDKKKENPDSDEKGQSQIQSSSVQAKKNKKKKNKNKNKAAKEQQQQLLSNNQQNNAANSDIKQEKEENKKQIKQEFEIDYDQESMTEFQKQIYHEQVSLEITRKLLKTSLAAETQSLSLIQQVNQIREEERYNQRRIEEVTSLLTGEVIYDKLVPGQYQDGEYRPPQLLLNSQEQEKSSTQQVKVSIDQKITQNTNGIANINEAQQDAQKKKKKRKKNKQKNKKNKELATELDPSSQANAPSGGQCQDKLDHDVQEITDKCLSSNSPQNQSNILESVHEKLQNIDEVDELESIHLDQIELTVKNDSDQAIIDSAQDTTQIKIPEDKKVNNYLKEIIDENVTLVQVISNIEEEIKNQTALDDQSRNHQEEDETKDLTKDITAGICKKVIFQANSKQGDYNIHSSENGDQKLMQTAKKEKDTKKGRRDKNNIKQLLKSDPQITKNQPYSQLYSNMQFLEHPQSPRSKSSKKHVEFKIPIDENEDEIKIPKRGSSRGSSVGTEDVIHQHTLSSLGELFPSEYKNPSDDTKIKIIEITTSSNNSSVSPRRNHEGQGKNVELVKKQTSSNQQQLAKNDQVQPQQQQQQQQVKNQNQYVQRQNENLTNQNKKRNSQHQLRKNQDDYHNNDHIHESMTITTTLQYQKKEPRKDQQQQLIPQQNITLNNATSDQKKTSPQAQRKKDKQQTSNNKQQQAAAALQQANFDSYQSMFQTAYNDNPSKDKAHHKNNHKQNNYTNNKQERKQSFNQNNLKKTQNEVIVQNNEINNSISQSDKKISVDTVQLNQDIEEKKQNIVIEVIKEQNPSSQELQQNNQEQTQDVKPQNSISMNQPLINLKKPKKPRQENRDLREQGISVNPDIIHNANKKNQLPPQLQITNSTPIIGPQRKQIKPKPFKPQQTTSQQNQQFLNIIPLEQRSQTPIVEQTIEPLTGYQNKHTYPNGNNQHQKKQNQNQKQYGSNNINLQGGQINNKNQHKKKSSNLGYQQQQQQHHHQQHQQLQHPSQMIPPQLNQFLPFDQAQIQQQQQFFNQSMMGLIPPQNQQPTMLSPQQLFQPQINPQMYFNPLMQPNQSFMMPPSPNSQMMPNSLSPQPNQFQQQIFGQPGGFVYPFQQQMLFPKFQNTQETQTEINSTQDSQNSARDSINNSSSGKVEKQKDQTLSPQQQLQNFQNQGIQTMMNQFSNINNDYQFNINIQVYQMPFQTQPIFNNFNQGMIDQQINPFMMQNLQNQIFNPIVGFAQPAPFIPQMNNPLLIPPQTTSPYSNPSPTSHSQFNQPFTNFQFNQTPRNVSHQTLDQYKNQNREELFFKKFDREIYKLQIKQQMKLQKTEHERQVAFRVIEQFVKEAYQEFVDVKVQMYGSMATGLAIDSSDMDVLVSGVFNQEGVVDRMNLIEQMKRLHKQLNKLYCLESNSIIETATVPVIKIILDLQKIRDQQSNSNNNHSHNTSVQIEDDMKHLKIDITFNDQENEPVINGVTFAQPIHMGIKCCHFIKQKLSEYPQLQSLSLLLKKFLALRDLNSPFLGGLSSYGLVLLIIAFINQDLPQTYDPQTEMLSPARIFTQFLIFFGRIFDVKLSMINEFQQIVALPFLSFSSVLIILDPLNINNNIGKSTYNFDQIRNEFSKAYDKILTMHREFIDNKEGIESIENEIEEFKSQKLSILNKVLYEDYQENENSLIL